MRPNESTAWIRKADVSLRQTQYRIVVNLSALRLIAYDGATPFLDTQVAVGTGDAPPPPRAISSSTGRCASPIPPAPTGRTR